MAYLLLGPSISLLSYGSVNGEFVRFLWDEIVISEWEIYISLEYCKEDISSFTDIEIDEVGRRIIQQKTCFIVHFGSLWENVYYSFFLLCFKGMDKSNSGI